MVDILPTAKALVLESRNNAAVRRLVRMLFSDVEIFPYREAFRKYLKILKIKSLKNSQFYSQKPPVLQPKTAKFYRNNSSNQQAYPIYTKRRRIFGDNYPQSR